MDKQPKSAAEPHANESHGVLVGWSSQEVGGSMVLKLQTLDRSSRGRRDRPDRSTVVMTRSQAAVLANYLLKAAKMAPPPRRKGWIASLFG